MIGNSWGIATVRGIRVGIHPSWLLVVVFFTWALALGWFPAAYPGWAPSTYWVAGAVTTVLLFVSILLHEFGHALTALRLGVGVRSITLFIFGGVATLERESDRPGKEFWIAVMGPVVSLALAAVFYALRFLAASLGEPVLAVVTYLTIINGLLVAFNMIPGFPLDGGRILRAIIWGVTGNYKRATFITSTVGQVFAYLLVFLGITRILGGNLFGGIWTTLIGWFLLSAASASYRQAEVQEALSGIRAAQLLRIRPSIVTPEISLAELVYRYVLPNAARAHIVMDDGRLVGLVTLTDVRKYPPEEWDRVSIAEAMTAADELKTIRPDTPLTEALQLLATGDYNQLPVLDGGKVTGLLSRADIMSFLSLQSELGVEPSAMGGVDKPLPAARV